MPSRVWWNLQSNYRYCEEDQIPNVPKTGSAIYWINHYPEEKRYQINKYIDKFTFSYEERIQKSAQLLEEQRN